MVSDLLIIVGMAALAFGPVPSLALDLFNVLVDVVLGRKIYYPFLLSGEWIGDVKKIFS